MHRFIIFLACIMFFAPGSWAEESLLPVKIIAHRGLTTTAPENSMASLQAAWQAGLHGAEIDIRTSADGIPVLLHDPILDQTTNGTGPVDQKKLRDLQLLRLINHQGETTEYGIPRLCQVLTWAEKRPEFVIALDLKDVVPATVAQLVLKHDLQNRVILCVGSPEKVEHVRILKNISDKLHVSLGLGWWWRIEGLPAFAVSATGADSLFAVEWYFPARGFQEAREAGATIHVFLWGRENLPVRMQKAAALGAHMVSSDEPMQLLPFVRPR